MHSSQIFPSSGPYPRRRLWFVRKRDIIKQKDLEILAESKESGVYVVASRDRKQIFVTGHSEYDADTLKKEYLRDVKKGLSIKEPKNYFFGENPEKIHVNWRAHAHLLYSNWLNYYVYQQAPFDIDEIK